MPCQESDSTEHDQKADRENHSHIPAVGSQGGKCPAVCSHQVEACVAEGRDGMEDSHPDSGQAKVSAEHRHQHNSAHDLNNQHKPEDKMRHSRHTAGLKSGYAVFYKISLQQRQLLSRHRFNESSDRYYADAACLYENQYHRLSER